MVATLVAISSRWYAFDSFCVACSLMRCFLSRLSFVCPPGPKPKPKPSEAAWWCALDVLWCWLIEATPVAARTARLVASSTRRLILTRSKKTAGSIGRGRGVL